MGTIRFPDRAVQACVNAMNTRRISPRHVKDVVKYVGVDVEPIEEFLFDEDDFVRKCAVEIIGKRGNKDVLVGVIQKETDKQILLLCLKLLGKDGSKLEEVVDILENTDPLIRYQAIETYRKSGKSDCLIKLLFEDDDKLVERVKRYMENDGIQKKA